MLPVYSAAFVVIAVAAAQTTGSDVAVLKLTADGQQPARVNVNEGFTSVESATFVFEFSSGTQSN